MGQVPLTTCRPVIRSLSCSGLQLTWYHSPHLGHFRSLCRPSSVGAIDPVGMTNASATNPRKNSPRITAIAIDSTVSRQPPSGGRSFDVSGFLSSFTALGLVIDLLSKFEIRSTKHETN